MGESISRGTDGAAMGLKRDVFLMDFRLAINLWGLGIMVKNVFLD